MAVCSVGRTWLYVGTALTPGKLDLESLFLVRRYIIGYSEENLQKHTGISSPPWLPHPLSLSPPCTPFVPLEV